MAIKAGRVGVAPSQVDIAGNITGAGSGYTKAEADEKFATKTELSGKVPASQLKANSKDFYFAYDETSEKYGYKAGSDGDFVPFEQAGVTIVGWVKPADLVTTGLTESTDIVIDDGGYVVKDGVCYVDILAHTTATKSSTGISICTGLPAAKRTSGSNTSVYISGFRQSNKASAEKYYASTNAYGGRLYQTSSATDVTLINVTTTSTSPVSVSSGTYLHVWGQYEIETT